jgi:hypothetical protein
MAPTAQTIPVQAQADQIKAQREAVLAFAALWQELDATDPLSDLRWGAGVLANVLIRRDASAQMALDRYNQLRKLLVPGEPELLAILARADADRVLQRIHLTGPYQVNAFIKSGLSPKAAKIKAFPVASKVAADEVLKGGRTIIGDTISQDRVAIGYARLPKANACAFCIMLASRGAVYSKDTVLKTTGRSRFGAGKSYHTNCACAMYPVFTKDQPLADLTISAGEEWLKHTKGVPTREQLKIFRSATGRR